MSERREFWIAPMGDDPYRQSEDCICYTLENTTNFPDLCFVHVREVLPEEITDTERLELMAEKGWGVARNTMGTINDHWFVFNHRGESQVYRNTFREAIDWAMENIR